jgi:hypothetical protein
MMIKSERTAYLRKKLTEVEAFIARDKARLEAAPGDKAYQLSLTSWEHEAGKLRNELADMEAQ